MKIEVTHRGKRYLAVPCGKRCSFSRPYIDATGNEDVCLLGCCLPKWFTNDDWEISNSKATFGLREVVVKEGK